MSESTSLTVAHKDNVRLAAKINEYWKARGIKANARAVRVSVEIRQEYKANMGSGVMKYDLVEYDPPKLVGSEEIESDLGTVVRWF